MQGIVKAMDAAMKSMNMEKIAKVMDTFEQQFENLDVQASYVENAMDMSTSTTTPVEEVDDLIQKVADEHGLEVSHKLEDAGYATYPLVRFIDYQYHCHYHYYVFIMGNTIQAIIRSLTHCLSIPYPSIYVTMLYCC